MVYILDPLLNTSGEKKTQTTNQPHNKTPKLNKQSIRSKSNEKTRYIHIYIRGQNYPKTFTLENQVNDFMKLGYSVSNIWVLKSDGKV